VILLLIVVVGVVMLKRASDNAPSDKPGQEQFATSRDRALLQPTKTAVSPSQTAREVWIATHSERETPRERPL